MRKPHPFVLLALLGGSFGCDAPPSPISPEVIPASASRAAQVSGQEAVAPKSELVATPNGWYHRSCVHEIPSGATEHRDGTITARDGASIALPECRYPGKRSGEGVRIKASSSPAFKNQPPDNNGWIEFAWDELSGHTYSELSAQWTVPNSPSSGYSGSTGPYFTFPGLLSDEYILQPVLQYGNNGWFGENYWALASWRCHDVTTCTYSTPIAASVGDAIGGVVSSSDCVGGQCTWTVTTSNFTASTETYRAWEDTVAFYSATGGAVEVYDISSCLHYPRYGVSFTSISLKNESGTTVTPSWDDIIWGYDPSCSFSVSSASTTVDLTHFAPLSADLTGDNEIAPEEECAWQAWGNGGIPPYSYNWWGALSGSSQTIYGELSESSWLRLAVTDSRSVADTAQLFINVDQAYTCQEKK
jgi:hypothetical protein